MKQIRQVTSLTFLILLFLIVGLFLYIHENMSLHNIVIYFGRILLLFLVPTIVVLLILFMFQYISRKKGR